MGQPGKKPSGQSRYEAYDFVVFEEKDSRLTFSLGPPGTRKAAWEKICLAVAKMRLRYGWYRDDPEAPLQAVRPPDVDPKDPISKQAEALAALQRWEAKKSRHADEIYFYNLIQRVKKGNAVAALELIETRARHEYESYWFENFTNPDKL